MKYYGKIEEAVDRLEDISSYEGTEIGEMWESFVRLYRYREYMSTEMRCILENDIIEEANRSHISYKLTEREETYTEKVIELEYLG